MQLQFTKLIYFNRNYDLGCQTLNLEKLTFNTKYNLPVDQKKIVSLMNSSPNLKYLKCEVPAELLPVLCKTKYTNLETLDITISPSAAGFQLLEVMEHFTSVTTLHVTSLFVTRFDFNKLQQIAKNLRVLRLDNLVGMPNCILTLANLQVCQILNSQITSLHILSNDLEVLEVKNCSSMILLELIGECETLHSVSIEPKYAWLKIKVAHPFLLEQFDKFL